MKLGDQSKIIGFCLLLFLLFYFISKRDTLKVNEINQDKIEDFDIILSKGQSVQSRLISFLKLSTNDYSHIGILVKVNGEVFVLHSTPDGTKTNGIRYDDLQTFIALSHASDCIILRHKGISYNNRIELTIAVNAYKSIQKPFDFEFDNFNNEKIYCSELVWLIFKKSGVLKQNIFDLTRPIYPKYFQDDTGFISINCNKTSP